MSMFVDQKSVFLFTDSANCSLLCLLCDNNLLGVGCVYLFKLWNGMLAHPTKSAPVYEIAIWTSSKRQAGALGEHNQHAHATSNVHSPQTLSLYHLSGLATPPRLRLLLPDQTKMAFPTSLLA